MDGSLGSGWSCDSGKQGNSSSRRREVEAAVGVAIAVAAICSWGFRGSFGLTGFGLRHSVLAFGVEGLGFRVGCQDTKTSSLGPQPYVFHFVSASYMHT